MNEAREKFKKIPPSDRNDKSKTPLNIRTAQNRCDLTPIRQNLLNTPNSQIKTILKEQILKKNLADSKISINSSKNFKNFPFTNKKLNLNFNPLSNNEKNQKDSTNEFQNFFYRDYSHPKIFPLTTKQNLNPANKMARLLKNLIPSENCSNSSYKDTSVNILLTTLKRENSTGRLSHRSSTAEIRKKNAKNNLTPINDRSSKPPYLSIKDYLEGKNKKKILITPITPLKNDKNSNSKNINKDSLEDNNTQKKIIGKNEDQKLIIKEIKEDIIGKSQPSKSEMQKIKNEECKKIPDFFVKVNINIENNLNNSEDNEGKKNLKLKKEMIKNSDMVNIKNDLDKRKNLIENLKNSDKKIEQLLNSQMKNTNITTSLNVTQEKNKNEISSKTSNKFFELSNNLTPAKRGEEKKTNKIENQITEQKKNEKLINFLKTEEIFMKDQPNNKSLENVILLEETLTHISKNFKENQKIIGHCKNYLNIVAEGTLECFEVMYENENNKDVIKEMIILERVVVIAVISMSFDKSLNPKYVRNFINLLEYIHQNFIMFIELILEKVIPTTENQNILEELKKVLISKKKRDTSRVSKSEIIQKNLTILLKILDIFIKENKFEPFLTIKALVENLQKITISESTQYLMQCFYSLIIDLEQKLGEDCDDLYIEDTLSEEQLSYVNPPYLQDLPPEKINSTYTLVLDLDETLVHYEELNDGTGQFLLRPFSEAFLEEMSKYFEVVIFTAALQDYADYILNIMDEKNTLISNRLYRKHCVHNGSMYIKDLSRLGRDLSKLIIIDNLADNFQNQPENGIFIQSWYGEPEDKALYYLAPLLKEIVIKKYDDVRVALHKFKEKMIEKINKGSTTPHMDLNLD